MNPPDPAVPPRLVRRRIPRIFAPAGRLEPFEPRLALSANPGADLMIEAFDALDALNAPDALADQDRGHSGGAVPTLVDQAARVREQYSLTGAGQTIAVIDSGVAWDHVALGGGFGPGYRVIGGWDFAEGDADPYDDGPSGFHGTHVGGLVIGDSPSFTGIAPGADLVGLRVFDDLGRSSLDWIESALQWVYDHRQSFESPITTVNLSLGALLPESLASDVMGQLDDELRRLHDASIVVVAAAGNAFDPASPDQLNYPASSPSVWPVASNDSSGDLSAFSQRDEAILSAIGRGVYSTVPDHVLGMDGEIDDYHRSTGTSMATPQIAAASMLVRQAIEQTGGNSSPDHLLGILRDTAVSRLDPVTGQNYLTVDLSAAIASVLGGGGAADGEPDDSQFALNQHDLGIVQWAEIEIVGDTEVHVVAAREGLFSIGAGEIDGSTVVRIADASGQLLWNGPLPDAGQIDIPVVEHQALSIRATGGSGGMTLQLANVIGLNERHVTIASGPADPTVAIDLSNGFAAAIGNLRYRFAEGSVTSGLIDGGERADALAIQGSSAAARLNLNPYLDGSFAEGGVELVLRGFEDVRYDGGGGDDRVFLYDTRGDDQLYASPGAARLEGVGFRYEISNVARSYVHATAGGQDMAFLNDSPNDDLLAVRPQFVSLRGGGFFNSANGFERVYAYATGGGLDRAELYDSAGDDRLTASATTALISGPGYYVQARHFDSVTGHATAGGSDRATLYADEAGGDRWIATSDQVTLRSADGSDRIARGFERVEPYQAGVPVRISVLGGLARWAMDEDERARERATVRDFFAGCAAADAE